MDPPKNFLDFLGQLYLKSRDIEIYLQNANRNSAQLQPLVPSMRKKVNLNTNLVEKVPENTQPEQKVDKNNNEQPIPEIQQNQDNKPQNKPEESVQQTQKLQDLNQIPESIIINKWDKLNDIPKTQVATQSKLRPSNMKKFETSKIKKKIKPTIQNVEFVNKQPTHQIKPNEQDQISDIVLDLDQEVKDAVLEVNIIKDTPKKQIIQLSDLKPKRKQRTVLKKDKTADEQDNEVEVKFIRQVRDDELSISYSSTSSEISEGPFVCTHCGYKPKSINAYDSHLRKCLKNDNCNKQK